MTLRKKAGLWVSVLIVVGLIIALTPVEIKTSILNTASAWFDRYTDAVENSHDDDDDDDDDDDAPLERLMVRIDDEISGDTGIKTKVLASRRYFPESKAVATVVDIRPLVALKARYHQAISALNVAKVSERSAAQELKRLNTLAKGVGSVATKKVAYARGVWQEANASLKGLEFEVQAVKDDVIQSWGVPISEWVLSQNSKQWQRLLSHQDSLLLVQLPTDVSLSSDSSFIRIARDGAQQKSRKAYFVSPAISTGTLMQGESYFFKIATGKLRIGMRLDAWIPTTNNSLESVFVPDKAIVWYDGQPWIYVKQQQNLYQRRSVQQGWVTTKGLFIELDFIKEEPLVVQGAQMLLSEEFRWKILDEDDD